MKGTEFIKMTASGNDFIIMDNRSGFIGGGVPALVRNLCRRRQSVGADGLLLIEKSRVCDFRMRIFNPDGGEVDMCGNGARCVAYFACLKGITGKKMTIETGGGRLTAEIKKDTVKVKLANPVRCRFAFILNIGDEKREVSYLNTGVPHVVMKVNNLDRFDVKKTGEIIRHHEKFQPEGTNADFIQITDANTLKVRTYERGVEGETLACGTGAVASAVAAAAMKLVKSPVNVRTRGGETLKIYFKKKANKFSDVFLEGRVRTVYYGATL